MLAVATYIYIICRSVAAGNMRKYDDTFVPLQDNVAITVKAMAQHSKWVHAVAHWHWAHIGNFLFTFICIPFSVLWEQVRATTMLKASNPQRCHQRTLLCFARWA